MARLDGCIAALAGLALLGSVNAASAAPLTETFSFNASPGSAFTPSAPQAFTGSFTLTYDPSVNSSGSLPSFTSNLPNTYGSTWEYSFNASIDALSVGDNCISGSPSPLLDCYYEPGPNSPTPGPGLFVPDVALLTIYLAPDGIPTTLGTTATYTNADGSIQYQLDTTATVPEPASMLLMAGALGGLAVFRRRRS